jgi:hypothetical protein
LGIVGQLHQDGIANLGLDHGQRGPFNQHLTLRRRPRSRLWLYLVYADILEILDRKEGQVLPRVRRNTDARVMLRLASASVTSGMALTERTKSSSNNCAVRTVPLEGVMAAALARAV